MFKKQNNPKTVMILIYTTCKDKKEAEKISLHLIGRKLAACTNYFPINSMYKWKGKLVKDKEFAVVIKTQPKHFKSVESEIKKLHSYECPCIIRISGIGNKQYEQWLKGETNARSFKKS